MAVRMVLVVAVVAAVATEVLAGLGEILMKDRTCIETTYNPKAPIATGNTVWLYVFWLQSGMYHSGIGTQGSYWSYNDWGQYTRPDYTQDNCNGPLTKWYRLGTTHKSKEEVDAIVADLVNKCYPGYVKCWKFIAKHFDLALWNSNYFTHHLAEALGVVDDYPGWLYEYSPVPGLGK